jgi:hypothetical protein
LSAGPDWGTIVPRPHRPGITRLVGAGAVLMTAGAGTDRYQIAARMERLPLSRWRRK